MHVPGLLELARTASCACAIYSRNDECARMEYTDICLLPGQPTLLRVPKLKTVVLTHCTTLFSKTWQSLV